MEPPCFLATLCTAASLLFLPTLRSAEPPAATVEKVTQAVGGADKLLKLFRIDEVFHFGNTPEPPAGKTRTKRSSVIEPPKYWWLGTKERADEPAKFDVWAWTLGILHDNASHLETLPPMTDEGASLVGLRVTGSISPAMDLYFDEKTHLLARVEWREDIYRFSEWKDYDGLKYASRTVIFKKASGKPWFYHDVTAVERLTELPANLKR
jgi:hypothetical protein